MAVVAIAARRNAQKTAAELSHRDTMMAGNSRQFQSRIGTDIGNSSLYIQFSSRGSHWSSLKPKTHISWRYSEKHLLLRWCGCCIGVA